MYGDFIVKKRTKLYLILIMLIAACIIIIPEFFDLSEVKTENNDDLNMENEQEEILETWDNLNADERRILMNFVRTLKK